MRKPKFRLLGIIATLCSIPVIYTCFAEKTYVDIDDEYFLSGEIDSGNQSTILFEDYGAYGFGFFFLGEPIWNTDPITYEALPVATLEHNGVTIKCYNQLIGYYTTNYTNFGMFPIDEYTANKINNGVQFITGGLFADCENESGELMGGEQNNVYGYIKRQYGNDGENIHEIRAGITETERQTESDLKLITSDDGKNVALSGFVFDSLAKNSHVTTNFFEKILISIPDDFFKKTKALSGNLIESLYYSEGINGYGLFFLGTGIDGNYEVTDTDGQKLNCLKQINGYYLINFNDFGMFPLDKETETYSKTESGSYGITIQTGGLYYDCKKAETDITYTGVYGYIRWKYLNYNNTHEMWAGVDKYGHWQNISPLEIIYSENPRNVGRSLSGTYHTSLAKHGQVINRLFGDVGLSISGENISTFSGNTNTILIDYVTYKTNDINIYIKSSLPGTRITSYRRMASKRNNPYDRIYQNGNFVPRITYAGDINMGNTRSNVGFYGLYETGLIEKTGIVQGTIGVTLENLNEKTALQQIGYEIINTKPEITLEKIPIIGCSNQIKISASADKLADTIKYTITGNSECGYTTTFTNNYTDILTLNDEELNGKYICFMAANDVDIGYKTMLISGIDTTPPIVDESPVFTGLECETITGYILAYDNDSCDINVLAKFEGEHDFRMGVFENGSLLKQTFRYSASYPTIGEQDFGYTVKDSAGNTTNGILKMERVDNPITGQNFDMIATFSRQIIEGEGNWKELSNAHAGDCEQIIAQAGSCKHGSITIEGDIVNYQYRASALINGWYDTCNIEISDGDSWKEIVMKVVLCRDNGSCAPEIQPIIVGGTKFIDRCYTGGYNTGNVGSFLFDSACNNMPLTLPSDTQPHKYTSGSHIIIDINKQKIQIGNTEFDGAPIARYRVSCLEGDSYCTEYRGGWNDIGCDGIYTGYFQNIWSCKWSNTSNNGNGKCSLRPDNGASCCKNRLGSQRIGACLDSFEGGFVEGLAGLRGEKVYCEDLNSQYCRRGCNDVPGSGYFEHILGCTYTDNTLFGQCIAEDTLQILGVTIGGGSSQNGTCWRGCSTNVIGKNNITDYINECKTKWNSLTNNSGGYECINMESARSNWMTYEGNIDVDIEALPGCSNYGNLTPNGSKYLGERTIWVQVEDTNRYRSKKEKTDIVIYDIGDYRNVNRYHPRTTSPILTEGEYNPEPTSDNKSRINWNVGVEDAPLLHGLLGYTGLQSEKESMLMDLYQRYISFSSYHTISKNMITFRLMKGICQPGAYQEVSGTFTTRINNNCTCSGPSCTGDYNKFVKIRSGYGLTGHIPAMDYGCEKLEGYVATDVTPEKYQNNPNMICIGELTGISCSFNTTRRIREFSGENAKEQCQDACYGADSNFGCFSETGDNPVQANECEKRYPKKTITLTGTRPATIFETVQYTASSPTCNNYCNNLYGTINQCYNKNNTATKNCRTEGNGSNKKYYYKKKVDTTEIYTYTGQVDDIDNPIYYYYDHIITKTDCNDIGYPSCNVFSCAKYNDENTFNCNYNTCTDYLGGCIDYETEHYTSNTYVDSSCLCTLTNESPEEYIAGTIDENLYRCIETGNNQNEVYYQCYRCMEYQCIRDKIENGQKVCKEQAYSSGVTYFTLDQPQYVPYSSHLKLRGGEILYDNYITSLGGPVNLKLRMDDGHNYNITGFKLQISSLGVQNWMSKTDINVSIDNIDNECIKGIGKYILTINPGLITDFAFNTTNSISTEIPYVNQGSIDVHTCNICKNRHYYDYNAGNINIPDEDYNAGMINQDLEKYCNNRENLCDPKCVCRGDNAKTQQCICNPQSNSYDPSHCELNLNENNTVPKPSCDDPKEERDAYCSYPNHKDELECACRGESKDSYECTCTPDLCYPDITNNICFTSNSNKKYLCTDYYNLSDSTLGYCRCNTTAPDNSNGKPNKAYNDPERSTYCQLYSNSCTTQEYNCNLIETGLLNHGYIGEDEVDFRNREARCQCGTDYDADKYDFINCNKNFNFINYTDPRVACDCDITENGLGGNLKKRALRTGDNINPEDRNLIEDENTIQLHDTINIPTENPICDGVISCEESESCPGFSCEFIKESENCNWSRGTLKGSDGYERSLSCNNQLKISVEGKFNKEGEPLISERTGCIITMDAGSSLAGERKNINKKSTISFYLDTGEKAAFMAGTAGEETYYLKTIKDAVHDYGGDIGFYFFNNQQQWIKFGTGRVQKTGVLGNVNYDINFNQPVADQAFHIKGTAIIHDYKKELSLDIPTLYYENPDSYLSTFPEY